MKKPIFYTLVGKSDPRVMAVTTVRGGQAYGRWVGTEQTTHCRIYDTYGKFDSWEKAHRLIRSIAIIRETENARIMPLFKQIGEIESKATSDINRILLDGGAERND
jgi:hypothetical protein